MPQDATVVDIARAFTEAWTRGDIDAAASFVAEDVVFDGPLGHVDGKEAYMEGLKGLVRMLGVTGVQVISAYGDTTEALIMYDLLTERFGSLTCAKLLTMQDGKIRRDRLIFDSHRIRQPQGS